MTNWDLLARAGSSAHAGSSHSLGEVLRLYIPALRKYIERGGRMRRREAEDILQAFLADKIVSRRLLDRADRCRGRFHRPGSIRCISRAAGRFQAPTTRAKELLSAFEYDWAKCVITGAIAAAETVGTTAPYSDTQPENALDLPELSRRMLHARR